MTTWNYTYRSLELHTISCPPKRCYVGTSVQKGSSWFDSYNRSPAVSDHPKCEDLWCSFTEDATVYRNVLWHSGLNGKREWPRRRTFIISGNHFIEMNCATGDLTVNLAFPFKLKCSSSQRNGNKLPCDQRFFSCIKSNQLRYWRATWRTSS